MPDKQGESGARGSGAALRAEAERLFALRASDPHAVLGAHPTPRGVVVRAYRPEAARVELAVEGESPREMERADPRGLYEVLLEGREQLSPYILRAYYPDGNVFQYRDPYAFMPTLGNFDEHLFGEGRHWKLYEKLGAHVRRLGSIEGRLVRRVGSERRRRERRRRLQQVGRPP
jgi:1,4-alpha-glucan branching enzyme